MHALPESQVMGVQVLYNSGLVCINFRPFLKSTTLAKNQVNLGNGVSFYLLFYQIPPIIVFYIPEGPGLHTFFLPGISWKQKQAY